MSIVEVQVTPTFKYFYRRSKREIIDKMEQMRGEPYPSARAIELFKLPKGKLASMAMDIVRKLPNE